MTLGRQLMILRGSRPFSQLLISEEKGEILPWELDCATWRYTLWYGIATDKYERPSHTLQPTLSVA
jgi:hypothetical protein